MFKLFFVFFTILSLYSNSYAESREAFVDKIIDKTYNDNGSDGETIGKIKENVDKLSEILNERGKNNLTTQEQVCQSKTQSLNLIKNILKIISPIMYFGGVILVILSLKKLFFDNTQQMKNGRAEQITSSLWLLFFSLIFLRWNSFVVWYDENIVVNFASQCAKTSGKTNMIEALIEFAYHILFMMMNFFGVVIIIIGILEFLSYKKNQQDNSIVKSMGYIAFGTLLINHQGIIKFFGG